MSLLKRLIAGGDGRPTRLHTENNELIDLARLAHDLPVSVFIKLLTSLGRQRPIMPWWPYAVIPIIANGLNKSKRVIEFGSGSSTLWLSKYADFVHSIEDDESWATTTESRLKERGVTNAKVTLASGESYYNLDGVVGNFDLAVVDGSYRWKCISSILSRMNPGGIIYLDNADADKDFHLYPDPKMHKEAQKIMKIYAATHPDAELVKYRSLAHGELSATEGWILRLSVSDFA